MNNGRSKCVTQITRRLWQGSHAGGQFWREQRRLRICWVDRKLAHEIIHHGVPCGTHKKTVKDVWGIGRGYRHHSPTNRDIHPHQQDQSSGARQHWYRSDQKLPRQWCHATAWHPEILATLTSDRHLGRPVQASTIPPCWGRRRSHPGTHRIPPVCPPPRSWQHALWVYQDWVHQNNGNHMDGEIKEDGKWQDRQKNLSVCQPNTTTYRP